MEEGFVGGVTVEEPRMRSCFILVLPLKAFFFLIFFWFWLQGFMGLAFGSGLNLKGRYFWLRYGAKNKPNECLKRRRR